MSAALSSVVEARHVALALLVERVLAVGRLGRGIRDLRADPRDASPSPRAPARGPRRSRRPCPRRGGTSCSAPRRSSSPAISGLRRIARRRRRRPGSRGTRRPRFSPRRGIGFERAAARVGGPRPPTASRPCRSTRPKRASPSGSCEHLEHPLFGAPAVELRARCDPSPAPCVAERVAARAVLVEELRRRGARVALRASRAVPRAGRRPSRCDSAMLRALVGLRALLLERRVARVLMLRLRASRTHRDQRAMSASGTSGPTRRAQRRAGLADRGAAARTR